MSLSPNPAQIAKVVRRRERNHYLSGLVAGACFLAGGMLCLAAALVQYLPRLWR
jgi:hypothetical protein